MKTFKQVLIESMPEKDRILPKLCYFKKTFLILTIPSNHLIDS